ncbi:DUF6894 family protein [Methylobacterium iners]|uniref:DUF6894 family protein n=1 Tax=Methylobacterium iners TaxID=418707 RepID=UPI001EE1EF3B|nr:hypothetical protein [Methylobacterium iners]
MARYFFDVHRDGLSHWDDEGAECEGRDGIVVHAAKLLAEVSEKYSGNKVGHAVVASVRDSSGKFICTATLSARTGLRMQWTTSLQDHLRSVAKQG